VLLVVVPVAVDSLMKLTAFCAGGLAPHWFPLSRPTVAGRRMVTWLTQPHLGHLMVRLSAVPLPKSLSQLPQRICGAKVSRIKGVLNICAPGTRVIAL
jgi:hypothetical protein